MKIGIDASKANTKYKTGTEWYSYNLITNIAKFDNENEYILYIKDKPQEWIKNLPKNFKYKILSWLPKFFWSQIRLSIEMFISSPDILFVPAHTIPLVHPKITVTTCHDTGFERYPELYATKRIGPKSKVLANLIDFLIRVLSLGKYRGNELEYHRYSMRMAVKKAEKIISPSEFTKKEIIHFYNCPPDKIVVIPHGYDKTIYRLINDQNKVDTVLKKYKISSPYLLFIGRLEKKKNIIGLVESFGILKNKYKINHKLVLIGYTGYGYDEAEKKIHNLNIKNDIILTGWVGIEELPYIIAGADLFIFPTFYEGFGMPVIEVMACGIAIVASRIPCIEEVAKNSVIYFNPESPEELADKVIYILNNQTLKNKMIGSGLKHKEKYSWEETAINTIKVFNSVRT